MNVPAMRIIIASASAVVFDKTGTLTYGTMDVADVLPCPGEAAARFSLRGGGWLYAYCNRHGLIRRRV